MFISGNISFVIGPFVGWLRDLTNSYVICFHSLAFIMALCVIPWFIELLWFRMSKAEKLEHKHCNDLQLKK